MMPWSSPYISQVNISEFRENRHKYLMTIGTTSLGLVDRLVKLRCVSSTRCGEA